MTDDLAHLDAIAQAQLVRDGEATPSELVAAAISRIEALNPTLNAVITDRFDAAVEEARGELPDGPFRGVPILLKDLGAAMAGEPIHMGAKFLKDADYRSPVDSHIVTRLRRAGFVVLGRTNTPEFGSTCTTEPEAYGATRNPWNTEHSPGGSSGGSAAAVASRMVPVAHASDGGGSIRIPASECGLFGLKPSRGRISRGPLNGEGWGGASTDGCLSVTVRDTAAVLDLLAGYETGDPYTAPPPARPFIDEVGADPGRLRIGIATEHPFGSATHPDCLAAVEATASLLSDLGHEVVAEARPDALADVSMLLDFMTVLNTAARQGLRAGAQMVGRPLVEGDVEFSNWESALAGDAVSGAEYLEALDSLHAYGRRLSSWWAPTESGGDGFDLLLTPTISGPPPLLGHLVPDPAAPHVATGRVVELIPFTAQFNVSGQPAMSVPLHWAHNGLPIGSQLVAGYGREALLVRVASQLEAARPWADRRPPMTAASPR